MKHVLWLLVVLVLSLSVSAALCSDADSGGASNKDAALKQASSVKYGVTTQFDVCLTSEEGVSTNKSKYLREYFCDNDQRQSKVYDCVRYGYQGCENGACYGAGSGTQNTSTTSTPVSACGNKRVEKDKGEQCDPPGSICFGKTTAQYGSCNPDCTCKIAKSAEKSPIVCGDADRDVSEECEEDKDCPSGHVCSSCKCVKQLTAEEIEAMKKAAQPETKTEKAPVEESKPKVDVDLTAKNFSEEPGMQVTSSIAGFFKKIFGWIASLFS